MSSTQYLTMKKRCRKTLLLWFILLSIVILLASYLSNSLLIVADQPESAEVIIVLGGESAARPFRALELYQQGYAPRVLISGDGDNDFIKNRLILAGIHKSAIFQEKTSSNTYQNAINSTAILQNWQVNKAIIVTSWYHSRRAVSTFRQVAPHLQFISIPAYQEVTERNKKVHIYSIIRIFSEYIKLLGYWVKYSIAPIDLR